MTKAKRSPTLIVVVVDLMLIAGGFAAIAYLNREWLLNQLNGIDQWVYTGYFLHYDTPNVLFHNRKIARLPWILSGFALNQLFAPALASQILHGGYFLVSCTTVYFAISKMLDRSVALLTALFCLFCAEQYGPGGWDYNVVAGGVFYILTFIAVTSAAEQQNLPLIHFSLAGVLLALTLHTNIIAINLLPVFAIQVVAVLKRRGFNFSFEKRWLAAALIGVLLGAVACTVVLGLANLGVGRQFLFYATLIDVTSEFVLHPSQQLDWWEDWSSLWWVEKPYMALYGGVLALTIGCLAYTVIQRRRLWADTTSVLFLEYIVAFLIFLGWQIAGQTALQPNYMVYPLMFPMIFALAGAIALVLSANEAKGVIVSWLCAIALAAYMIFGETIERVVVGPFVSEINPFIGTASFKVLLPFSILICGFAFVAVLAAALRRTIGMRGGTSAIVLTCMTFVLAATDKQVANADRVVFQNDCVIKEPVYVAIIESSRYLFDEVSSAYRIDIWYDRDEPIGITSCHVPVRAGDVGRRLIFSGVDSIMPWPDMTRRVADIPIQDLKELDPKRDVVAVISETATPAVELANELSKISGTNWRLMRSTTLTQGPLRFMILIVGASQDAMVGAKSS